MRSGQSVQRQMWQVLLSERCRSQSQEPRWKLSVSLISIQGYQLACTAMLYEKRSRPVALATPCITLWRSVQLAYIHFLVLNSVSSCSLYVYSKLNFLTKIIYTFSKQTREGPLRKSALQNLLSVSPRGWDLSPPQIGCEELGFGRESSSDDSTIRLRPAQLLCPTISKQSPWPF